MSLLTVLAPSSSILCAILAAYVWLLTPQLAPYALQAFASVTLLYLGLKRLKHAKVWHLLPSGDTLELALITFACLLLVGATGATDSHLFAVNSVYLFFLVLAASLPVALIATVGILSFYLGISPEITPSVLSTLALLPLLLVFFLFAKKQYDEARVDRQIIAQDATEYHALEANEQTLEVFLQQFLQPKLRILEELSHDSAQLTTLKNQLSLLQSEVQKLLDRTTKP